MMRELTRTSLMALLVVLNVVSLTSSARAQTVAQPLELEVEDLLGGDCSRSWGALRVLVRNRSSRHVEGVVSVNTIGTDFTFLEQPMGIDAGEVSSIVVYAGDNWCSIQACFQPEQGTRRCSPPGSTWREERGSDNANVLLIQRELELRPALAVAQVRPMPRSDYIAVSQEGETGVPPRVALARYQDPAGPPDLPEQAPSYHTLRMVIAEAGVLAQIPEVQRRTLSDWLVTGGEVTVVGQNAEELAALPLIRELVPGFSADGGEMLPIFSSSLNQVYSRWVRDPVPQVPIDQPSLRYHAPGLETTSYGSRIVVGLGSLHLILASDEVRGDPDDGPPSGASIALEELLDWPGRFSTYGWNGVQVEVGSSGYLPRYVGTFDSTDELNVARRLELDPNLNARLPLWAYLLVVLVFTVAIFMVQHRWSKRGGKVSRLIVTTGGIALAGCMLVFVLVWLARGPGERYRSMAWIEAASGTTTGVIWRRLALASDEGGIQELPLAPGIMAAAPSSSLQLRDGGISLRFPTSRWETVIAAEHGVVRLDGTVTMEWADARQVASVRNELGTTLRHAVLVMEGSRYDLGDLEAGESVAIHGGLIGATLPAFVPDDLDRRSRQGRAAVAGEIDMGCPDRGGFAGDQCTTTVVIWGRP